MIYLKNPQNNQISSFESWAAIGAGFKDWTEASVAEISAMELEKVKAKKIANLNAFHESDAVKRLTIKIGAAQTYIRLESDYRYLIDEQIGLLELRIKKGEANPVWNYQNGITLPLNLSQLSDVRIYIGSLVDANFNAKRNHEKAINVLNSIEAVNAYDFTANYRLNQILPFSA